MTEDSMSYAVASRSGESAAAWHSPRSGHGLEYAAQAMGVHVGLLNRTQSTDGSIGYVGGLSDMCASVDRLDECPAELTIDATRLFKGDNSFIYQFAISFGGQDVMTGRASIFLKYVHS